MRSEKHWRVRFDFGGRNDIDRRLGQQHVARGYVPDSPDPVRPDSRQIATIRTEDRNAAWRGGEGTDNLAGWQFADRRGPIGGKPEHARAGNVELSSTGRHRLES